MAEAFDPYRKWLAIPPEEQPPHYYRLLAIPPFESDLDVISNAVDARMSQIKSYQNGPYAKLSQQILNQLAAAKICLLDPRKKAVYDQRLREKLQGAAKVVAKVVVKPVVQAAELDLASLAARSSRRTTPRPRKKPKSWMVPAIAAGSVLVALVAAAVVFMLPPPGGESQVARNEKDGKDSSSKNSTKQPSILNSAGGDSHKPPLLSSHHAEGDGSEKTSKPASPASPRSGGLGNPTTADSHSSSVSPLREIAETHESPKPADSPSSAAPAKTPSEPAKVKPEPELPSHPQVDKKPESARLPVPSEEQQQAAERQIREIFQKEFAAASSPEGRARLAGKLAEEGRQSSNDVAARYVLCKLAAQEFVAAGSPDKAMEVIDAAMDRYDADMGRFKADVLGAVFGTRGKIAAVEPDIAHRVCKTAMKLSEGAVALGNVDLALQFAHVAAMAASRAKDPQLESESGKRSREIERLKVRCAVFQKALDALRADPADAEANLKAGQWYCFVQGKWSQGLPMLAKGGNAMMAAAATQDLAAPTDVKLQVALADAWWNVAEKESPADKTLIQARARHWYGQAVQKTSGLEKARIQKRLEEETDASNSAPSKPAGRELVVDVTDLSFAGKTYAGGGQRDVVFDTADVWPGYKMPPLTIPGARVRHFFFLHAPAELHINLEAKVKAGQAPKRFKAYLGMPPVARQNHADGIIWTVEAHSKSGSELLVTTSPNQDFNPVNLVLPPRTTEIVVRSLLGPAKKETYAWGVMINPVITFRK